MNYADNYLRMIDAESVMKEATEIKPRKGLGGRKFDTKPLEVDEDVQNKYMQLVRASFENTKKEMPKVGPEEFEPTEEEMAETSDEVTSMVRPEARPGTPIAAGLDEREILAKTLQAEAGNQGYEGLLATGAVIANRVKSGKYGKGLKGVILKPGQFSAWNSETGYAKGEQGQDMQRIKPSAAAYKAADAIISGEYESPVGDATHYYNNAVSVPAWGKEKAGGNWFRIGDHIFGKADS